MRRYLLPVLFKNIPQNVQIGTGAIAAALPVVLQITGIARDICAGTQTPESLCARLTNISLVIGTGAALVATGGLSSAANALIVTVFVYVPVRDLTQYFLQLKDTNGSEVKFDSTCKAAAAYMINQIAVDQGMEMMVEALEPFTGETVADMLGRALVNTAGETVDDLTNRGLHSNSSDNQKLDISIGFRPEDEISSETALDQLFNTVAGRAALFSAAFSGAYAAPVTGIINSIVTGAILGTAYVPFVYCHPVKKQTESDLVSESGIFTSHPQDALSHCGSGNIV